MAQQARLIEMLASGIVDSTGVIVASGFARFYQPGTTNPITVYSDETATATLSQPVALDAGGRAEVYTLVPCRLIAKKSDDATTVFDGNPNYTTAQQVSVKNASVNGGAETTLDAILPSLLTSAAYTESATATTRTLQGRLSDDEVSVKDFGAAGDGATDDTAEFQAALDRCGASGKDLLVPTGTYLIASALALSSYTKKFRIRGCGAKVSIIKQSSTSANGFTLSYGGATDWGAEISGIGFTCSTASSGAAVSISNASNVVLRDVETSLFRYGVDATGAVGTNIAHCNVLSTDSNAASIGFRVGQYGRVVDSVVTGSGATGTGISVAGDYGSARGCVVSGVATGITMAGNYTSADGCLVTGVSSSYAGSGQYCRFVNATAAALPASGTAFNMSGAYGSASACTVVAASSSSTTGYTLGAAGSCVTGSMATGCATGLSIGAVADCRAFGNSLASNTLDVLINASATNYSVFANKDSAGTNQVLHSASRMIPTASVTAITSSGAFTPNITSAGGIPFTFVTVDTTAGILTVTWNATSTTGLVNGDMMEVLVSRIDNSANNMSWSFNAQYVQGAGGALTNISNLGAYVATRFLFRWNSATSKWVLLHLSASSAID